VFIIPWLIIYESLDFVLGFFFLFDTRTNVVFASNLFHPFYLCTSLKTKNLVVRDLIHK
jgi:hypothetical protein